MKTITYKLGEVCKWSQGDRVEFRYVDIGLKLMNEGGDTYHDSHQVLELPADDAMALVTRMQALESAPPASGTNSEAATSPPACSGDA